MKCFLLALTAPGEITVTKDCTSAQKKTSVQTLATAGCCGPARKSACGVAPAPAQPLVSAETWGWVTASTKNVCAGVITDCTDKTTCTTTGFGPCVGGSSPTAYLKSSLVGVAFVKEATYLTTPADMAVKNPTGLGYLDFKPDVTAGDFSKSSFLLPNSFAN